MNIRQHHTRIDYEAIFQFMIHHYIGIDWNNTLYWLGHEISEHHSFIGEGSIKDAYRIVDAIHEIDRRQDFHKLLDKTSKLLVLLEMPAHLPIDRREMDIMHYFLNGYSADTEIHFDVYPNEDTSENIRLHFILGLRSEEYSESPRYGILDK